MIKSNQINSKAINACKLFFGGIYYEENSNSALPNNLRFLCGSRLSRSSKKGLWRKLTSDEMLKPYKGQMSVSAELYFSPEQLKQRHVQSGKIRFYDAQGLYGTVVVDAINSRVK